MSTAPFPLNFIGDLFHLFFIVMVNLLALIIHLLNTIHAPGTLGLAILIITILIRFLVWPFMGSQIKVSKKMAEIQPHLSALKEKHKEDKKALAAAQAALYKEHNINPAGGCLTSIIQIPVLYSLYSSIFTLVNNKNGLSQFNSLLFNQQWHLNKLPDTHFLGLNLAYRPSDFSHYGFFLLLVPLVTAGLQFVQSSMMVSAAKVKNYPSDSSKEKKEKETADQTMAAMQGQMRYMMPVMIGFFAFQFPIGLAVYWNTFTLMGIWQQYSISGWGGVSKWFGKAPQTSSLKALPQASAKVETKTSGKTKVKIERS